MKSKDWSAIVLIIVLMSLLSFMVSYFTIGSKKSNRLKVEKVSPITANFPLPNSKYFNNKSLNLTQEIKIGEESNTSPFKKN